MGPKGDPFFRDSGQDSEGGPKKGTQFLNFFKGFGENFIKI